ncbi:MAG: inositol monophosphatase family protein [Bauldia sp.]
MTPAEREEWLRTIEQVAVELANLAGAQITNALGREIAVRYKGSAKGTMFSDPVSDVDQKVEELIRTRLATEFPDHGIIGEEIDEAPDPAREVVWAVDPIDGTSNFVNGFPLFAGSIGVLERGVPIVGAVWVSTSHVLRAGVYHAREGGPLRFDFEPATARSVPANRRHLAGEPDRTPGEFPWDMRQTGSAAVECAFVAAGLLRVSRLARPNIWDVAGGLALVRSAGGTIRLNDRDGAGWHAMAAFEAPVEAGRPLGLRRWSGALLIGEAEAVATLAAARPDG